MLLRLSASWMCGGCHGTLCMWRGGSCMMAVACRSVGWWVPRCPLRHTSQALMALPERGGEAQRDVTVIHAGVAWR